MRGYSMKSIDELKESLLELTEILVCLKSAIETASSYEAAELIDYQRRYRKEYKELVLELNKEF
jgi:hypothetical protein